MDKESKCLICSRVNKNKIFSVKEMTLGTRHNFYYILCSNCKSLSILSIPNKLENYYNNYPNLNYKIKKLNLFKLTIFKTLFFKRNIFSKIIFKKLKTYSDIRLKALYPYSFSKSSKILDVGCGNGEVIHHLKQIGYKRAIGIDPHLKDDSCSFIQKRDLYSVYEKFDLIMFHHSFEHMMDPQKLCNKIDSILKPNGLCIIRIPNIESFSFQFFKNNWEGIHAPFHFFLPTQKGMKILFKDTTLKLIEIRGEQFFQLFFLSLNRQMNISDYDTKGARAFFEKKHFFKKIPPLFTKCDYKYWKKKSNEVDRTDKADYVNYYYKKVT